VAAVGFVVLATAQVRALIARRTAEQIADATAIQADVEQGRQALLHGESAEAQLHLSRAYQAGDHSPGVSFMLARALQPALAEQVRLTSTAGRMLWAAFSPDGQRVVTTDDKSAAIWDAQTGRLLYTLPHDDMVYQAVYGPDGARVFTASNDGSVKIWDADSGVLVRELRKQRSDGKISRYVRVAVAPDGRIVAAIDLMGDVTQVWDPASGAVLAELRNDGTEFPDVAFSHDGHWLAASGGDTLQLFDTTTWTEAHKLAGPGLRSLSWDPTGPRLVTGTVGGAAAIWDASTGAQLTRLREGGESIDAVAFAPSGALVATTNRDGTESIWHAGSGTLVSQSNQIHERIMSVGFDPRSERVVAAGTNGVVAVVDAVLGMPVAVFDGSAGPVYAVSFDLAGRRVMGASLDGTARIWAASSPYLRARSPRSVDTCSEGASLVPDGRFLAIRCEGHETHVWDTASDRLLARLPPVTEVPGDFASAFPAVSSAGDLVALAHGNGVEVYALPGGQRVRTVKHSAAVNAVAFAGEGHELVSGAVDGSLLVTGDGGDPVALPSFGAGIDAAAILIDGRVVAADAGKRLRIYDHGYRTVLADLEVPARVRMLRQSPDGQRLVALARYTKVAPPTLWDLDRYRRIAQLQAHMGLVFSARFTAAGQLLTAGGDGTARLYDGATGRLVQTYRARAQFFTDATLSPDGTVVVAGGSDGLVRFWDTTSGRPLWTMPAHKLPVPGIHFEGSDLITRSLAGDVARWALPDLAQVIASCGGRPACALTP